VNFKRATWAAAWLISAAVLPAAAATAESGADAIAADIRAALQLDYAQRVEQLHVEAAAASRLAENLAHDDPTWRRLKCDELFALTSADNHAAAVQVYDQLQNAHQPLRPYAMAAAVFSLGQVGRSAEAEALARDLLRKRDAGGEERLQAGIALARIERWREDYDASERQLAELASEFPDSAALADERAALERQRGRPREATQLTQGRERAQAWLDLSRTDRAAAEMGDAALPADVSQRLDLQRGSRGAIAAGYAKQRAAAVTSPNGNDEWSADAQADSARLADVWRIGGHLREHRADFQDQVPEARYVGARVTRQLTGGEAVAEAGYAFDDFARGAYGVVDVAAWTTDSLRLGARVALRDPDEPLQARASHVAMDSLNLSAAYRPSPLWRLDGGAGGAHFHDGNTRWWAQVGGERRAWSANARALTAFASLYAGGNSRDDAPYFNPAHAESVELGAVLRCSGWWTLTQSLRPSVASSWQAGYGQHFVPLVSYAIRWNQSDRAWWELDAGFSRPVYDGSRESHWSLDLSYAWGAR